MAPHRLTRDEQRAQTRDRLLEAAGSVFARNGFHGTTVDQVAEAAGYTKGAVYSNFDSKEDLFLALLDVHLEQATTILEEVVRDAEPQERATLLGERRDKMTVFDRDWFLLETEFALFAARNDEARQRIGQRQAASRENITRLLAGHLADLGVEPDLDVEDVARLLIAGGDGLTIMALTQPEIDTAALMSTLLRLLENGLRTQTVADGVPSD